MVIFQSKLLVYWRVTHIYIHVYMYKIYIYTHIYHKSNRLLCINEFSLSEINWDATWSTCLGTWSLMDVPCLSFNRDMF